MEPRDFFVNSRLAGRLSTARSCGEGRHPAPEVMFLPETICGKKRGVVSFILTLSRFCQHPIGRGNEVMGGAGNPSCNPLS